MGRGDGRVWRSPSPLGLKYLKTTFILIWTRTCKRPTSAGGPPRPLRSPQSSQAPCRLPDAAGPAAALPDTGLGGPRCLHRRVAQGTVTPEATGRQAHRPHVNVQLLETQQRWKQIGKQTNKHAKRPATRSRSTALLCGGLGASLPRLEGLQASERSGFGSLCTRACLLGAKFLQVFSVVPGPLGAAVTLRSHPGRGRERLRGFGDVH